MKTTPHRSLQHGDLSEYRCPSITPPERSSITRHSNCEVVKKQEYCCPRTSEDHRKPAGCGRAGVLLDPRPSGSHTPSVRTSWGRACVGIIRGRLERPQIRRLVADPSGGGARQRTDRPVQGRTRISTRMATGAMSSGRPSLRPRAVVHRAHRGARARPGIAAKAQTRVVRERVTSCKCLCR